MANALHLLSRRTSRALVLVVALLVALLAAIVPFATEVPAHAALTTSGLVGYWPFDEGSGSTSADLSGSANTATLGSAAGFTSNTAPITAANPSAFNSVRNANSTAAAAGNNINGLSQFTLAFWYRLNPVPNNTQMDMVSLPGKADIGFVLAGDPNFFFDVTIGGSPRSITFDSALFGLQLTDGQWHHIAGSYDGTDMRMYSDGASLGSFPLSGAVAAGSGVRFSNPSTPLDGGLDDVRVYNRALSDSEVAGLAEFGCASTQGVTVAECNALAGLYNNTNGPHWVHHDGWLHNSQPCTWYGVLCDGNTGHVVALSLPDNGLDGAFGGLLGGLDNLVVLNLPGNLLTGGIPFGLGNVTTLTTLDVSRNLLSDPIPSSLGAASALQTLRVQDNKLRGPIPTQLANLTNLLTLDLGYNSLGTTDPTLTAFLNAHQPNWASTQTVAPTNAQAVLVSPSSIAVTWTPIPYTADGGYYDVLYAPQSTGVFQSAGHTADKTATGFTITGLNPNDSYKVAVRTFTPAHTNQPNDVLSDTTDLLTPATGFFTSNYDQGEYRYLYIDAVTFHRSDLASTQHDAAMFMAYLGGLVHAQGGTGPNLGTNPGAGPLAVTSTYTAGELGPLQQAVTVFSSDPATVQHTGVDLVAYLVIISGH